MGELAIRQTFNLYNTVGVIEKNKNIYYVPHKDVLYGERTASRTKVCDCFYNLFNTVSPFSSKYHDVEISQWSPEDRSLKVEGTIDDFRQSRGRGLALNYIIIKREITETENNTSTTSHYYFAFFIDSVEQSGSRAVKLNLSPDYFTNFFYLNVEDDLTYDYDPFNPTMKNCLITRQHYDRMERVNNVLRYKNLERILGSEESFKYKYQYKAKRNFLSLRGGYNARYELFCEQLKAITTRAEFLTFVSSFNADDDRGQWLIDLFISYYNIILKEDIMLSTSYVENNTNKYYKPGYAKYKGVTVPFVHLAIPFITIPKGFENIDKTWFTFNVYAVAYDLNKRSLIQRFTGKDVYTTDRVVDYFASIGANQYILTNYVSKYSTLSKNILNLGTYNSTIAFDFVVSIINEESETVGFEDIGTDGFMKANSVKTIPYNTIVIPPFSYNAGEKSEVHKAIETLNGMWIEEGGQTQVRTIFSISSSGYVELYEPTSTYYYWIWVGDEDRAYAGDKVNWKALCFVIGDTSFDFESMSLVDSNELGINKYVDPLLEAEPYSFYSVSINESEQIISKLKLIQNYDGEKFTLRLQPITSYNDSYKIGLIPEYYINQKYERYYSEAIVTIINTQVPIIEDSWLTYYVTNKAQMKNQFAVQQNNFASSMLQGTVSTVVDAGVGALKGVGSGQAGTRAVGGFVSGVGGLINSAIQNKFQIANIELSQKAKLADMGAKPDTVKFAGSDILYDMIQNERGFYVNYYRIDEVSYNSIAKYLERFGYKVNIYDSIHAFDRIGLNFVQIESFDYVEDNFVLSEEQMNAISDIFASGVTLLHDKDFLHNLGESGYHNYEYDLVAPEPLHTVTLTVANETNTQNKNYFRVYDGQDTSGTPLYESLGDTPTQTPQTLTSASGYITIAFCGYGGDPSTASVTTSGDISPATASPYSSGGEPDIITFEVTGDGTIAFTYIDWED